MVMISLSVYGLSSIPARRAAALTVFKISAMGTCKPPSRHSIVPRSCLTACRTFRVSSLMITLLRVVYDRKKQNWSISNEEGLI